MTGHSKLKGDRRGETYAALANHFVGEIWASRKGKLLLFTWAVCCVGTTGAAIIQKINLKRQRQHELAEQAKFGTIVDKEKRKEGEPITPSSNFRVPRGLINQLRLILPIAFPSLATKTTQWLLIYTALLISRIVLSIKIANITGRLGRMVGEGTFTQMFLLQVTFAFWCMPASVVNSLLPAACDHLALSMRQKIVHFIHSKLLSNLVFYKISNLSPTWRLDDIDQRASQDLKKFTSSLAELYGNLLKPILEVFMLTHSLGNLMGFKHLAGFFAYFILTGQFIQFCMPPFARMTAQSQKLEGEFRSNHTRIMNHAEEIAFYGGSETEHNLSDKSFTKVVQLEKKKVALQAAMGILDSYSVKYGATMTAYSMLIPAVYLGTQGLKGKSTAEIMQYYLTATQLFVALGNACKNLILSYKRIQSLTGLTDRVAELIYVLKTSDSNKAEKEMIEMALKHPGRTGDRPTLVNGDEITFKDVDIFSPTGQLLIKGLNFTVKKNTNVLISGRNGSGKSSLFRVLGGLWPLCSGTLIRPPSEKLFYIPQKPYLVPGTLRDQVTYPKVLGPEEDKKLYELMELVELGYVVQREGWDSVKDWSDVLSGGEKQRVAMARLFFHRPAFGILDECTSAVSMDVEAKIYETCHKLGITIFTVSHRPQLMHHHDYMLKFDGEGGWSWVDLHNQSTHQNLSSFHPSTQIKEAPQPSQQDSLVDQIHL